MAEYFIKKQIFPIYNQDFSKITHEYNRKTKANLNEMTEKMLWRNFPQNSYWA